MATKEKNVNAPPATTKGPQQTSLATSFGNLSNAAPAWLADKMKGHTAQGLEAADKDDFIYPRLVLCQALTPFVVDGKARVGDIIDNITGDMICPKGEALEFIPVVLAKSRMFMVPFDKGGGILCRSFDSLTAQPGGCGLDGGEEKTTDCLKCIHKEWDAVEEGSKDDDNGAPKCTLFYNILGILPSQGNRVMSWSGKATNVKIIRRFLSICKQTGADLWAHKFMLKAKDDQSAQFKFQNWDFDQAGWVTEAEYKIGSELFKSMTGQTWSVNTADLEKTDQPNPQGAGQPAPF